MPSVSRLLSACSFFANTTLVSSEVWWSMGGRPGLPGLDFHLQYNLKPFRCHLMTVSGCTIARADRQFGQIPDSATQKTRSWGRSLGRLTECLKTATCCRSARFSKAAPARPRTNALRKKKMDWRMPTISCSLQMGHPTGRRQHQQRVAGSTLPRQPQSPQLRISPGFKNR